MGDLNADTALERDTQYLADKGMTQVNPEQFNDIVTRFCSDGCSEDTARNLALKLVKEPAAIA